MRVLILATTTGYQTRSFGEAAERLIALGTDMIDTDAPAAMLAAVRELAVSASDSRDRP